MAPRPTVRKADELQTPGTSLNPSRDEVTAQPWSQKTRRYKALVEGKGRDTLSASVEPATIQASRKE